MLDVWHAEAGASPAPDANDGYLLLQSIVGVWPVELLERDDPAVLAALRDRLLAFIPKAFREAKRHSKWIEPNEDYESAAKTLVERMLADGSPFIERARPLLRDIAARGMLVSLARTVLKATVPGVPDFYQGTGLWDFSLVDPDNRRPVDYSERGAMLDDARSWSELLADWQDGVIKLRLVARLLADRQAHGSFYAQADYQPLAASGGAAEQVLAFTRSRGKETLVVVVPRLSGKGKARVAMPLGPAAWGDTTITLPSGSWHDLLTGSRSEASGTVAVGHLLQTVPFAVLRTVE